MLLNSGIYRPKKEVCKQERAFFFIIKISNALKSAQWLLAFLDYITLF